MNHSDVQARLAEYFEGDLTLDKRARVDAHLDECQECAQELAELRATVRMLRALPDPEPPPELADAVMRRIRAGESRPGLLDRVRELLVALATPRIAIPALATAAVAAAVTLVYGLRPVGTDQAPTDRAPTDLAVTVEPTRRQAAPEARPAPAQPEETRIAIQQTREPSTGAASPETAPRDPQRQGPGPAPRPGSGLLVGASTATQGDPRLLPVRSTGTEEPGARNAGLVHVLPSPQLGTSSERVQRPAEDWIDIIERKPARYARGWRNLSVAERELWVARLAERAIELERLDDVIAALRASGDPSATVLADAFAREARNLPNAEDADVPDGDTP